MINAEKKIYLEKLLSSKTMVVNDYYKILKDLGDLKFDYQDYISHPINCDKELQRLSEADYDLCCVLFTMLLREDHFCNGSFEERCSSGQVQNILERMVALLD